jgi:hypothetical protein
MARRQVQAAVRLLRGCVCAAACGGEAGARDSFPPAALDRFCECFFAEEVQQRRGDEIFVTQIEVSGE